MKDLKKYIQQVAGALAEISISLRDIAKFARKQETQNFRPVLRYLDTHEYKWIQCGRYVFERFQYTMDDRSSGVVSVYENGQIIARNLTIEEAKKFCYPKESWDQVK